MTPIKGFLETSFLDWPGKIAAVVFLPCCNFRCPFCHNARLILEPEKLQNIPLSHVLSRLDEFHDWIDGICITGGEPTNHLRLSELITALKDKGLAVKLDTNGSNPDFLKALIRDRLIDCVAMDIKAPLDQTSYSRLTGIPVEINTIRASIDLLRSSLIEVIFRMTVVPDLLREDDIFQTARDLRPAHQFILQQFRPLDVLDPALSRLTPWPEERLKQAQLRVDEILGAYNDA